MSRCQHIETEILAGRWKVGDRVIRRANVFDKLSCVRHGTVVRAYNQTGCQFGPYPEIYDVAWDDRIEHGFLPHGLDREEEPNHDTTN